MTQWRNWFRRWFSKPDLPPPSPELPPFITTLCGDCGATIIWQQPVVAGTAVVLECVCKGRWVAFGPPVEILSEKAFLAEHGKDIAGESYLEDGE